MYLDEVGGLSSRGQAMRLRFLHEREVRPVGAARTTRVHVRVLAAANRDPEAAIGRGP